jgi:Zn-dependent M28 family amino/carboxypeptidase
MPLGRLLAACTLVASLAGGLAAGLRAQPPADKASELMETVEVLASAEFEGRRAGTPGNEKARAWIAERFKQAGLTPIGDSFLKAFTYTRNDGHGEGVNIVGVCKGSGAKDDGAMVLTAHYDHLGVRDGAIHHGADDNASGIAVLLMLARHCQRTPWMHDAVFAAFDAEEQGLQGARAFVAAPPIRKDRIALNVNFDMVSRGDKGELYVAGTYHRPALRPVLAPVAKRAAVTLLFGHDRPREIAGGQDDWTMLSDHGPFHAAGIPFVYFGVEDHPDYHKPTDTAEKIDAGFFARAAGTIQDAVTALDGALPIR